PYPGTQLLSGLRTSSSSRRVAASTQPWPIGQVKADSSSVKAKLVQWLVPSVQIRNLTPVTCVAQSFTTKLHGMLASQSGGSGWGCCGGGQVALTPWPVTNVQLVSTFASVRPSRRQGAN